MERIKQIYKSGLNYKTMHYESECEKQIIYIYPEEISDFPKGWTIGKMGVYPKRNVLNTCVPLAFPAEIAKEVITDPKYEKNYAEVDRRMWTPYLTDLMELHIACKNKINVEQ